MAQYINKTALVAEIERKINEINLDNIEDWRCRIQREHDIEVMKNILSLIDTLEVKDANEALRTEYEKGRHDVIEKTLKWLWDLNQEHEIMSYTDSHVLDSEELQKYYKNNIEE